MINNQKILLLAPHPDDPEFSCGGSIAKWAETNEIYYAAFSPCNKSLPNGFADNILYQEILESISCLGIPQEHLFTYDFPVREFPAFRQEILETLIILKKEIVPDLVIMPNSKDVHQDHHVIYEEGLRAFKHCCLLGYELPWNSLDFVSNFHVKISGENLLQKWNAISAYKSQASRPYSSKDVFEGLARVRGLQVNAQYAEAFEMIRWVL